VLLISLLLAGCAVVQQPLTKIAEVPLPGSATRLDYQSLDPVAGRLYISRMGAGRLIVFDTKSDKVVADLPDYPTVTGVLAVPEEGKVFASAAGSHEVVVTDSRSLRVLARIPGARFPDGIAYVPAERRLFVSDESGGIDLVIDARSNKALAKIELGGEAGNTHYDPVGKRVWVAVQTRNEMVAIDPHTLKIAERYPLKGSDHPHGFTIDSARRLAYISCEGNNKLLVAELRTMRVLQSFDVTDGPDVLALDEGLGRLYLGCEGGAVDVFQTVAGGLRSLGRFSAPNAHTVSVDPKTHRVYVALKNVGGKPVLWILRP
jgi:DNA-binding beta-propeller fold protein YncE